MLKQVRAYWRLRHAAKHYWRTYGPTKTVVAIIQFIFLHKTVEETLGQPSKLIKDVQAIWVSPDLTLASHAYRVNNQVLAATLSGLNVVQMHLSQFMRLKELPTSVTLVVFWRTNISLGEVRVFKDPRIRNSISIVYDTDDLTFDPKQYNLENVAGLRKLSATHASHLMSEVANQQQKQILESDFFWGSTKKLSETASEMGITSFVVPNTIPVWMQEQANNLHVSSGDNVFRIVYASGSNTHEADFASAWPALQLFMRANKNSILTILGHTPIAFSEIPKDISSQIFLQPQVPHEQLIWELHKHDLSIAPLAIDTPFVEAKSALKYAQAGIVGVPTIASATYEFKNVINNGKNGWLASTEEEWLKALTEAKDLKTRNKVAEEARKDVELNHCSISAVETISQTLKIMASKEKIPHQPEGFPAEIVKKIVWVLPDLPSGSGGHRNVLRFANYLPKDEFQCVVLILDSVSGDEALSEFASEHYSMSGFRITADRSVVKDAAGVFATHHSTTEFVNAFSPRSAIKLYIVQDHEALFYPMGEGYLHALSTLFDERYQIICSGPWMANKIFELTGRKTAHFQFPVDRHLYHEYGTQEKNSKQSVVFFAKNDTPRRLFELGVNALERVNNIRPDVEIKLFGGSSVSQTSVSKNFEILGKLPTLFDLAELYRQSTVGLVFSTTNPSLVPYEMMACGLPVVDVKVPGDNFDAFGLDSPVSKAAPNSADVAREILKLLSNTDLRKNSKLKARTLIETMPSEQEVAEIMARFLRKFL